MVLVPSSAATRLGPNVQVGTLHGTSQIDTHDPVVLCKTLRVNGGTSASNSTALGHIYGQFRILDVRMANGTAAAQVVRLGTQATAARFVSQTVSAIGTYDCAPANTAAGNDWMLSGAANTITTVMATKASASAKDGAIDIAMSYIIVG